MCEMLIYVADSGTAQDPQIEAARFHPGDVVVIEDDGHPWTQLDIGFHVKLVKLPGVDKASLAKLTASETNHVPVSATTPSFTNYPRLRIYSINNYASLPDTITNATTISALAYLSTKNPAIINPAAMQGNQVIG